MRTGIRNISYVRDMYMGLYTDEQIDFIANYKYRGKTADDWFWEANDARGKTVDDKPKWMKPQLYGETAIIIAKLILAGRYSKNDTK